MRTVRGVFRTTNGALSSRKRAHRSLRRYADAASFWLRRQLTLFILIIDLYLQLSCVAADRLAAGPRPL